jgi:hypothetical protein
LSACGVLFELLLAHARLGSLALALALELGAHELSLFLGLAGIGWPPADQVGWTTGRSAGSVDVGIATRRAAPGRQEPPAHDHEEQDDDEGHDRGVPAAAARDDDVAAIRHDITSGAGAQGDPPASTVERRSSRGALPCRASGLSVRLQAPALLGIDPIDCRWIERPVGRPDERAADG